MYWEKILLNLDYFLFFRYWIIAYNNILLLIILKNVFKYLKKIGWIILYYIKFHEYNMKHNELHMKEFFKVSIFYKMYYDFYFLIKYPVIKKHFSLKLYKIWKKFEILKKILHKKINFFIVHILYIHKNNRFFSCNICIYIYVYIIFILSAIIYMLYIVFWKLLWLNLSAV